MKSRKEIMEIISQANSTEHYHRISPIEGYPVITDGVLAVAEAAGAFWLLDLVCSHQCDERLCREFQVWKLEVDLEAQTGIVRGCNDDVVIVEQVIPYTDFPLEEFKLFLIDGVILLPREY